MLRRSFSRLAPGFVLNHINREDITKGYNARVNYTMAGNVVIAYAQQIAEPVKESDGERKDLFSKRSVIHLPAVHMARFISVLEGTDSKCTVMSRTTTAEFAPTEGDHAFALSCTTTSVVDNEPKDWTLKLDAGNAVMLHRFLVHSLEKSSGFGEAAESK